MNVTVEQRFQFVRQFVRLLTNGTQSGLWSLWKERMAAIVGWMFDNKGGAYGREGWPDISETMLGKIRRGSLGGIVGRFGPDSEPLQASGAFRKSFATISETPSTLVWGSDHPLRDRIPYAGWNRSGAGYTPRYPMPDRMSSEFAAAQESVERASMDRIIMLAREGAGF